MPAFSIGDFLLRIIDHVEFEVQVMSRTPEGQYCVRYLDDGNIEIGVLESLSDSSDGGSRCTSPLTPPVSSYRYSASSPPNPYASSSPKISFATYLNLKRQLTHPTSLPVSIRDDICLIEPPSSVPLRRTVSHSKLPEEPDSASLSLQPLASYCERCFKPCIYRCKVCLGAFYCSKKCQSAVLHCCRHTFIYTQAWPTHKLQCGFMSAAAHPLLTLPTAETLAAKKARRTAPAACYETPPRNRQPFSSGQSTAARAVENVLDWLQDDNETTVPMHHPAAIKYNQPSVNTARILNAVTDSNSLETKSSIGVAADSAAVASIVEMFNLPEEEAAHCLSHFSGSADQAVEWLLLHPTSRPTACLTSIEIPTPPNYASDNNSSKDDLEVKWGKHNQHLFETNAMATQTQNVPPAPVKTHPSVISASNTPAAVSIFSGFVEIEGRKCNMELRKSCTNDAEVACYLYPKMDVTAEVVSVATAQCEGIKYHTANTPDTAIRIKNDENSSMTGLKCLGAVHVIRLTITQINSLLQSVSGSDDYKFMDTNSIAYGTRASKVLIQHIRSCAMSPFYDKVIKDYIVLTYQVFGPTGLFYAQSDKTERVDIAYYSIKDATSSCSPALVRVDSLETQHGTSKGDTSSRDAGVNVCEVGMIVEIMGCSPEEASRVLKITGDVSTAIDMLMGATDISDAPPPLIPNIN